MYTIKTIFQCKYSNIQAKDTKMKGNRNVVIFIGKETVSIAWKDIKYILNIYK